MSVIDKAKRKLIGINIPRDELAIRIAQPCIGMHPPKGVAASKALDDMDAMGTMPGMAYPIGESFRRAADAAVIYFHECIKAGTQPS